MKIEKIVNAIALENTYLLSNNTACLVIDPGSEPSKLIEKIQTLKLPLVGILLTHAHFDHIMGLEKLKKLFSDVPIYLNEAEKDWMKTPALNASLLLLGQPVLAPDADLFYELNHDYDLADFHFFVRATPGHSIGGVSVIFSEENLLFSGDALFKESIGRWDLPTGSYSQLHTAIENQLFSLPKDFTIFPGHGDATTLFHEKMANPFFRIKR